MGDGKIKTVAKSEMFRELPSVDELLRATEFEAHLHEQGPAPVTDAIRSVVAQLREEISSGLLNAAAAVRSTDR